MNASRSRLPQHLVVPASMTVVVGLGVSGMAICRHLERLGREFMVVDTRDAPPGLDAFLREFPEVPYRLGPLAGLVLDHAREVVLSPGVDPHQPCFAALAEDRRDDTGEPRLIGEIALFCRACQAPIVAITGANAKSTVTTLVGEMAREAGRKVAVGGNLGTPALDLLIQEPSADLYVLELSSFQLETTPWLGAESAAFLNLSEDHLDRHGDMAGYRRAKQRIFRGAFHGVINAEDPETWPESSLPAVSRFGVVDPAPEHDDWGVAEHQGEPWFMHGPRPLFPVSRMRQVGRHHQANALAAMAMGYRLGFPLEDMASVLERFTGLAHRSEWLATVGEVDWINDSKGTNVGATLAAIAGLGPTLKGRLILLAGGVGKGADFSPLAQPLGHYAREAVLFGQDAPQLAQALAERVPVTRVDDLRAAVERARHIAEPGDVVLLSPACASLDQFPNYLARGEAFRSLVHALANGGRT